MFEDLGRKAFNGKVAVVALLAMVVCEAVLGRLL